MRQLREFHSDTDYDEVYTKSYDPTGYVHDIRLNQTYAFIKQAINFLGVKSLAELGCGNATLIHYVVKDFHTHLDKIYINDYSKDNIDIAKKRLKDYTFDKYEAYIGKLEDFLDTDFNVDLIIMTEVLEHLKEPEKVLQDISKHCKFLILSTPLNEEEIISNDHYWSWTDGDIEDLTKGIFKPLIYSPLFFLNEENKKARFQLWMMQTLPNQ